MLQNGSDGIFITSILLTKTMQSRMIKCMRKDNDVYNRILEIAFDLFREKGYEATTTREIADLAGISRGHLRYYFGKKEELFYSYFSELRGQAWHKIESQCSSEEDPRLFALLLLRSYTELICTFSSVKDLETLQGYDIICKYENHSDVMTEMICKFSEKRGLTVDRDKLSSSVEIADIIMYKFTFDLVNQHQENLTMEDIWRSAARHGLFAYGVDSKEIDSLIKAAALYIEKNM